MVTKQSAPCIVPFPVSDGGTGIANANGSINLGTPTVGYVLTSDASGNATWQPGASSVLDGYTQSAAPQNTALGANTASSSAAGAENVALGYNALNALNTGSDNVAIGWNSMPLITTGSDNIGVGSGTLRHCVLGTFNIAIGASSLDLATGGNNIGIGSSTLPSITNGGQNVAIGRYAGTNYASNESANILIGHNVLGVVGESNTTRIGVSGQTACYVAGISGAPFVGNTVVVNSSGQLGTPSGALSIPSLAGSPTLAPTLFGALTPILFDTVNNKIWAYNQTSTTWVACQLY